HTLTINGASLTTAQLINNGQMQLSGGASDVHGALTSNNGAKVIVSSGAAAIFYDNVACISGSEFRVDGSAVFLGNVSGISTFTGSGTKDFQGGSSTLAGAIATSGSTAVQ